MAIDNNSYPPRVLGMFSLIMINIIAVDSIKTLPFSAKLGSSLIFYYLFCGLFFLAPVALITSELATTWPERGGIYVWVKNAFGKKWGFLVSWLQWVYNVVWYPAILNFIVATIAYFVNQDLVANKFYIVSVSLVIFWFVTYINCKGMKHSSFMSTVGSIVGVLVPMGLIIIMSLAWYLSGNEINPDLSFSNIIPKVYEFEDLSLITIILFGLMGLEMSSVHAKEVKNPEKAYPKATLISSVVILLSLMCSSFALSTVVKADDINLTVGVLQGFEVFLAKFNLAWALPILAIMMLIGVVSTIGAWVIGPAKALLAAADDDVLPNFMRGTNKQGAPVKILILQAVIVSSLLFTYVVFNVETAYLILNQLTAILALLMYALMFIAALKLRYSHKNKRRHFEMPVPLLWFCSLTGLAMTMMGIFVSFFPPSQIPIENDSTYQAILIIGILIFCLPAFILNRK